MNHTQQNIELAQVYLNSVVSKFQELKVLAEKGMKQLERAEDWHWIPEPESNSIAVIVKHMSGNMISRWTDFLTSDGEKSSRQRDEEFEDNLDSPEHIWSIWEQGWDVFLTTLNELKPDDLLRTVTIRQEPHLVVDAIERQMSHYSYHVGQIVYLAKCIASSSWTTLSIPKRKSL